MAASDGRGGGSSPREVLGVPLWAVALLGLGLVAVVLFTPVVDYHSEPLVVTVQNEGDETLAFETRIARDDPDRTRPTRIARGSATLEPGESMDVGAIVDEGYYFVDATGYPVGGGDGDASRDPTAGTRDYEVPARCDLDAELTGEVGDGSYTLSGTGSYNRNCDVRTRAGDGFWEVDLWIVSFRL